MKILMALIPSELKENVAEKIAGLQNAYSNNDPRSVRVATKEILQTIKDNHLHAQWLDEDEWKQFLSTVRADDPEFEARYILSEIAKESVLKSHDRLSEKLRTLFFDVIPLGLDILELPVDEEVLDGAE